MDAITDNLSWKCPVSTGISFIFSQLLLAVMSGEQQGKSFEFFKQKLLQPDAWQLPGHPGLAEMRLYYYGKTFYNTLRWEKWLTGQQ